MKDCILKLPLLSDKRYLVVGDIHGHYETFLSLLAAAGYDETTDIIISVGDMIDRGPKSYETLMFFNQLTPTRPNTYAIKGNHEYMSETLKWTYVWLRNGGNECLHSLTLNGKDQAWLKEYVKMLPWVIDVGEQGQEGAFRIIHAEIPMDWSEDDFQEMLRRAFSADDSDFDNILWSRHTIYTYLRNVADGYPAMTQIRVNPNRSGRNIYAGHTPLREVTTVGDITYLDTWGSSTLSLIDAVTKQVYSVPMID